MLVALKFLSERKKSALKVVRGKKWLIVNTVGCDFIQLNDWGKEKYLK